MVCEQRAEALETLRAARGGLTAQEGNAETQPMLRAEVARLEKEVDALTGTLRELGARPEAQRCSGTAFVSFREPDSAVRLLKLQAAAGSGAVARMPVRPKPRAPPRRAPCVGILFTPHLRRHRARA